MWNVLTEPTVKTACLSNAGLRCYRWQLLRMPVTSIWSKSEQGSLGCRLQWADSFPMRADCASRRHRPAPSCAILTNVKYELRASLCRSRCFLFFPPRADRELPVQLTGTVKPHACSLPACFHSPASKLAEKHLRISQAPTTCSPQQLHACRLHRHLWCSCRQRSTAARGCACGA